MSKFCMFMPKDTEDKLHGGVVTYVYHTDPVTNNDNPYLKATPEEILEHIRNGNLIRLMGISNNGDVSYCYIMCPNYTNANYISFMYYDVENEKFSTFLLEYNSNTGMYEKYSES